MIEYILNADGTPGKNWNVMTGCLHTLKECPTMPTCWARSMARRFKQICGEDFQPRLHYGRMEAPLGWRKSQRVAVCFLGDLFGDWEGCQWPISIRAGGKLYPMREVIREILALVSFCSQHTFLFLTKAPQNLARWNPWPNNAWVGASAWDYASTQKALYYLRNVKAKVKWLSLEPVLGRIMPGPIPFSEVSFVVVGPQTGSGAFRPPAEWLEEIAGYVQAQGLPLWEKNASARILNRPLMQELPA